MKKKLFLAGILSMALVFGFVLAGCKDDPYTPPSGSDTDPKFTGTWINGSVTLVINAPLMYEGNEYFPFTLNYPGGTKTGSIADNGPSITFSGNGNGNDATYTYTLNGSTLSLTEFSHGVGDFYNGIGVAGTYTKQ
jgi:hypothetical protein